MTAAFRALLRKETRQWLRSFQWPAFALVLLFFAISDPLTTRYQEELFHRLMDTQPGGTALTALLPAATMAQAITKFIGDAAGLGSFVLILISMGWVAGERESGVTEWVLTRPVSKRVYLLEKGLTLAAGVTVAGLGVAGFALLYSWTLFADLPAPLPVAAALLWSVLGLWVRLLWIATVVLLASTVFRTPWAAAGGALGIWLTESLIYALVSGNGAWARWLPYAATGRTAAVLAAAPPTQSIFAHLWQVNGPALLVSLVGTVLLGVLATELFVHQEG